MIDSRETAILRRGAAEKPSPIFFQRGIIMDNPIDIVRDVLDIFESGRLLLSHGHFEWKLLTNGRPLQVWITEVENSCGQVCHGNVNTFGVSLQDDGFVLVADVQSDQAEIMWLSLNS
jgi:hypothetical protein